MALLKSLASSGLLLVMILGIGACSQKQESLGNSSIQVMQPVQSSAAIKTLKPGAPVSVMSPRIIQISANSPAAVDVRLQVLQKGKLRIKLSTSDGLQLLATPEIQRVEINGEEVIVPVQLSAPHDGRFYLHLNAALEAVDGTTTRNLAIVVQVGEATAKALKPAIQGEQRGEAVISLPAREAITP